MARTYRPQDETAEALWTALVATNGTDGATRAELKERTSLTEMQFQYALSRIRDVLQVRRAQPIAYNPRTRLYSLPSEWVDDLPWVEWRTSSLKTQVGRLLRNIEAAEAAYGIAVPGLRIVLRDAKRLSEDLSELTIGVTRRSRTAA